MRHRNPSGIPLPHQKMDIPNISYEILRDACNGLFIFSVFFVPFFIIILTILGFTTQIGKGGFGEVYKGIYEGQGVAVKTIRRDKAVDQRQHS